jgi:hypothetical protein
MHWFFGAMQLYGQEILTLTGGKSLEIYFITGQYSRWLNQIP